MHQGDLIRDAWIKQQMEGIAEKVNTHEDSMTANLERFTQELRDAWLLQQHELAEAIRVVRLETQSSGNGVSSDWQ